MRLVQDFKEYTSSKGFAGKLATALLNPCFHSVCLFRLSNWFYRHHLAVFAKIVWYINRVTYHVDIDYRADLAGGFVLIHGLGTVIGCEVCSTGPLTVFQGVTIGGNNGKTRVDENGKVWGQPCIGDNVTIYTDACVFGPVIISDNSVIKAKQLVTKDM